jgi:hypothetical protein
MNMEYSFIQLNNLPDEILLTIFKKLDNIDVLYSLIGVNKRLDNIVQDSIFTKSLSLRSAYGLDKFANAQLDRLCSKILPKIYHKIEWLETESLYMDRIFRATHYSNLHHVGLYCLRSEEAHDLFTGNDIFISSTLSLMHKQNLISDEYFFDIIVSLLILIDE